jgi:hypothetical protein
VVLKEVKSVAPNCLNVAFKMELLLSLCNSIVRKNNRNIVFNVESQWLFVKLPQLLLLNFQEESGGMNHKLCI